MTIIIVLIGSATLLSAGIIIGYQAGRASGQLDGYREACWAPTRKREEPGPLPDFEPWKANARWREDHR